MTTDQLCAAAIKRLAEHINRSAGQHAMMVRRGFAQLREQLK